MFFIVDDLNAVKSYINAAVRFREGDVDLASVIYPKLTMLQVLGENNFKITYSAIGAKNNKDKIPSL